VPADTGIQKEAPRQHENRSGNDPQRTAPVSAVNKVTVPKPPAATTDSQKQNDERNSDERVYRVRVEPAPTSGWTIAYVISGLILGVASILTLVVLYGQVKELRNQIRLQERGLRQWVNTRDWKSSLTEKRSASGRRILEISFLISNATKAPIMLILVSTTAKGRTGVIGADAFPNNTMLLPSNPIRHRVYVPLSDEEVTRYSTSGIKLKIGGDIRYTDALEDSWGQTFSLSLTTCSGGTTSDGYLHVLRKLRKTELVEAPQPFWRRATAWYADQIEAIKNGESEGM
jgi:hypothetical protein